MKGKRRPKPPSTHYSMMDELLASTSQPMPQRNRDYQLKQMNDALQELMQAPRPTNNAWRIVSDAVNLLETLVQHGEAPIKDATGNIIASHWRDCDGDAVEVRDSSGLLLDAIAAMTKAGQRMFDQEARQASAFRPGKESAKPVRASLGATDQSAAVAQEHQPCELFPIARA